MANNFDTDARIIEFWQFENNLTAGKAGNDLTGSGSPTYESGAPLEGAYSLDLEAGGSQYAYRTDADLSPGFPLKSGDSTKKISVALWVKPESVSTLGFIIAKWSSTGRSFAIDRNSADLRVSIGYNAGASGETWTVASGLFVAGRIYHIGVVLDGLAKTCTVRVWDDFNATATTYTHTFTNTIYVGPADFVVGRYSTNYYDGLIDELVVCDDLLTVAEIDQIRSGTYVYVPTTAIVASGGVEVSGESVVTFITPLILEVVTSGGVEVGGQSAVTFPPISANVTSGGVEVGGESVVVFITPPVLAIVTKGGVVVGGQSIISSPPVSAHVVSGGVRVGGQSIVEVVLPEVPPVLAVVTSGGVAVGGDSIIGYLLPSVLSVVTSGGAVIGGASVVKFVTPADLTLAIVGSGGPEVGGTSVITFTSPPIYAVPLPQSAADANIFVGGASIVAFIHPQILAVIAEGGVAVGGEPLDDEIFETWVLTGARGEPSIYANFPFNSYAKFRNQYFGAGPSGIYRLEGSDDAGDAIHPGVRIGPMNFGTDREKRLRLLRCGGSTTDAQVKVSNGNGSAGYYDVEDGRAAVSREIQGREITVDITDFETLDHLELVPLILHKR